jgi:hypothetical protein
MVCLKAFLGLMESVREFSVFFHTPQLGLSLVAGSSQKAPSHASSGSADSRCSVVVGSLQKPDRAEDAAAATAAAAAAHGGKLKDRGEGVEIGDVISKINGVPVADYGFDGVIHRIRMLPRPMIVHFIKVVGGGASPKQAQGQEQAPASTIASTG